MSRSRETVEDIRSEISNIDRIADNYPGNASEIYADLLDYAERNEIDDITERMLEQTGEKIQDKTLEQAEEIYEEVPEDDTFRYSALAQIWGLLNDAEKVGCGEFPETYHKMRSKVADEGMRSNYDQAIGLITNEFSLPQSGLDDEFAELVDRYQLASDYALFSAQMAEHTDEPHPADQSGFDHKQVINELNSAAVTAAQNLDGNAGFSNTFIENLETIADTLCVSSSLVDAAVEKNQEITDLESAVKAADSERISLKNRIKHSEDLESFEPYLLEQHINKARRKLTDGSIPDSTQEYYSDRLEDIEEAADKTWHSSLKSE